MINDIFCFIPAKGASTRLKEKNILPIMGKEMIGYSIEAAIKSDIFKQEDVIVSTESKRVAKVAKKFGANILTLRAVKLSLDPYGVVDVLLDFLMKNPQYKEYKNVMILLPTTPTIESIDLLNAYSIFKKGDAPCLMSVNETRNNAYTSVTIKDGLIIPIFPEQVRKKSQELIPTYDLNAAITILDMKEFLKEESYFLSPTNSYVLDSKKAVDVDTYADFNYAKYLLESSNSLKYIIDSNTSVKEALLQLGKNRAVFETLYIIDNDILLGSLTYGDINTYIDKNISLSEKVSLIMNTKPKRFYDDEEINVEYLLKNKNIRIYRFIPLLDRLDNRVIKFIDILKINNMKNRVILMVGGLGNRLRPLTIDTPKPMLKVGNKPILHTIVDQFKENNFFDFTFCVNYKSEVVKKYFKNGKHLGVNIEYIFEKKRLGTAGALSLLDSDIDDDFFVMNGDLLTDVNFKEMLHFHKKQNNVATMCVIEHQIQIPYGVIEAENAQITDIIEKPIKIYLVNAGIYLLSPAVLSMIPREEFFDMPTLFNNLIKNNKKTGVYKIEDYWLDIGHHDDYIKANSEYERYFGGTN